MSQTQTLRGTRNVTHHHGRGEDQCSKSTLTLYPDGRIEHNLNCDSLSSGYSYLTPDKSTPGVYIMQSKRTYTGHMAPPGTESEQVSAGMCTEISASEAHQGCMAMGYRKCDAFLQEKPSLLVGCNLFASHNKDNQRSGEKMTRLLVYPSFEAGGGSLVLSSQGGEVTSSTSSTWKPHVPTFNAAEGRDPDPLLKEFPL